MALSVRVFNSGYAPISGGPGWDDRATATWPSSTATLIAGAQDAILVDALMTADQGRQLASWIAGADKNLTHIVITHGHGDHFFGAGPVLQAYRPLGSWRSTTTSSMKRGYIYNPTSCPTGSAGSATSSTTPRPFPTNSNPPSSTSRAAC
jgi:glyoxylase-like metal-dependent hydrolase (beta-lactamase superfamily II)